MFIGHFALALGAKKYAPQASLGILFLACQLADIIWPNLVLLGIETLRVEPGITVMTPLEFVHYPYSHSLIAILLWSAVFAVLYWLLTRSGTKAAIVIGTLVLSHWILDVITHRPDMPITLSDSPRIGLGLWNSLGLAVSVELLLFAAGVWLYVRHTRALDRIGSIGFWSLVAFLVVIYAGNLLGPPPPSATAVAWSAQALWLVIAWGFWVDRHRLGRPPQAMANARG
ncbi:MAG: metal-dependent hydrolase [Gammaproteobacteria bacterium]|nr:metal-dependent hydrolase [Gammaproteobacteria bacterium]MDH3416841.1 metal-dependent hydrolase [Gammaproteobacteria bacterium]